MQGLIGACSCSMCPSQPLKYHVPSDKLKEIAKMVGQGEVDFDELGTFTINGQMIDPRNKPGGRNTVLDAIIVTMATEAVTLVHPKLYENGMLILQEYYRYTKRTREKLEQVRVAPTLSAIPLTFYDALAWQIMKGPQRAADIAINIARSLCRDSKNACRMSCLLWKKDKKSKSYPGINTLISRLGGKRDSKILQEDCVRILACLGADQDQIMRLAKVKPILKAFGKVMDDGTDKAIDTALWLSWRMTSDDDFCQRLSKSSDVMKVLIRIATLDHGDLPGLREENALAVLANLSVQDEVCLYILDVYPELLKSAALFIEVGSTRAAELGALLMGNLAFDESALSALSTMDIDVSRLLSLMIEGGDRARELGTLALANLTRIDKFVHQLLAEDGAIEVILSVRGSGVTGRAREAAGRVVANCSVYRLQSNGTKLALGKAKAMSESKFNDITVKRQEQIKPFGIHSQTFCTPWTEAKVALTGKFPEIAKRSESQLSNVSSKVGKANFGFECEVSTITTNMPPISAASDSSTDETMALMFENDVIKHVVERQRGA